MRTPADHEVVFAFYSHPAKDLKMRWQATLAFAPGSTDSSYAALSVVDGEGAPLAHGVFEFAGLMTRVKDGKGRIKCADFVRGLHEQAIWLHRRGMAPVPGALTFA